MREGEAATRPATHHPVTHFTGQARPPLPLSLAPPPGGGNGMGSGQEMGAVSRREGHSQGTSDARHEGSSGRAFHLVSLLGCLDCLPVIKSLVMHNPEGKKRSAAETPASHTITALIRGVFTALCYETEPWSGGRALDNRHRPTYFHPS